jgi:hypothetical protein
VISGRIANVHANNDDALKVFKYVVKKEAAGHVP